MTKALHKNFLKWSKSNEKGTFKSLKFFNENLLKLEIDSHLHLLSLILSRRRELPMATTGCSIGWASRHWRWRASTWTHSGNGRRGDFKRSTCTRWAGSSKALTGERFAQLSNGNHLFFKSQLHSMKIFFRRTRVLSFNTIKAHPKKVSKCWFLKSLIHPGQISRIIKISLHACYFCTGAWTTCWNASISRFSTMSCPAHPGTCP